MLRNLAIFGLTILAGTTSAAAQHSAGVADGSKAEIAARLRSFYFNLARGDWEALTADVLAAKVVAHRAAPKARPSASLARPAPRPPVCSMSDSVSVEHAVINIQGDWAAVTIPHCAAGRGWDEFRLIRFSGRWRFVSIELFQQPVEGHGRALESCPESASALSAGRQPAARASSNSRSCTFRVSDAARSNSSLASFCRPNLVRRSPRTAGSK